jgi:hypothetical protein
MVSFILPGNSASTGYEVNNSCMFDSASSQYLSHSPSSASNRRTWTLSFWTKRAGLGQSGLFGGWTSGNYQSGFASMIYFNNSDQLEFDNDIAGQDYTWNTDMRFRDVASWYNIVIAIDTTQSTEANRQKVYVNGSQVDLTESALGFPTQNFDTFFNNELTVVSSYAYEGGDGTVDEYEGYMAEVVMIDGQQLDATSFGEFDSDSNIWKPIDVSGLTFGTNGFYLEFKQSGTSQNSSGLGADTSGNDNHFAVSNLSATNQSEDTCTNNYATMNSLLPLHSSDFRNGAVEWRTTTNSQYYWANSTIGVSQGKWYIEAKLQTAADHNYFGISADQPDDNTTFLAGGGGEGGRYDQYEWGWKSSDGKIYNNTDGGTSYGSTYTSGDILGMYLDLDNNKLYFAKNGTIQNSGTGISITDPASTPNGVYFIAVGDGTSTNSSIWEVGFGNPSYGVSSANTDPNGYGTFEYSPNAGGASSFDSAAKDFYALNTKNLAEFG